MDLRVGLLFTLKKQNSGNEIAGRAENSFAGVVEEGGFAPGCILPVQYFARSQRSFTAGPEGRLMLAVLEDAVNCYLQNMNRSDREALLEFREVNNWFNARNSHDLFAFETICDVLSINPGWMRRCLQALRHAGEVRERSRSANGVDCA
jgi:hypothetical protein